MKRKRVVVEMSGGVDSSLTAALLLEEGYEVIGITMRIWPNRQEEMPARFDSCCTPEAVEDARQVANKLEIPFYVLNCKEQFDRLVIEYFCREYARGYTPNPCIVCNERIKFSFVLHRAREIEADYVATGHYACNEYDPVRKRYILRKGLDKEKDQSYVLFSLRQEQLAHILFPLGYYTKKEVREMACTRMLPVHNKPDSQEICFIPNNDYTQFLEERQAELVKTGPIIDKAGRELGTHSGIHLFTIGQRRGLGLSRGKPLYVVAIDKDRNAVVVGSWEDVMQKEMVVAGVNFIPFPRLKEPQKAAVQIRYRHRAAPAVLSPLDRNRVEVTFTEPQPAITPGQAAVFYQDDYVLGGGWIVDHRDYKSPEDVERKEVKRDD